MILPQYGIWSDKVDSPSKPGAYIMIWLIWGLWYFITIFNVVILLNFLIAFISTTYEQVYDRGEIDNYINKAAMNHEWRLIKLKVRYTWELVKHWTPYISKHMFKAFILLMWVMYYMVFILPIDILTLGWLFGNKEMLESRQQHVWAKTRPVKWFQKLWDKPITDSYQESVSNFNYVLVSHSKEKSEDESSMGVTKTLKNHIDTVVRAENTK